MDSDIITKRPGTSSSPAAARMRLHRQRLRKGVRSVCVQLHVPDIDALINERYLEEKNRDDSAAIQEAANCFISDALGGFL
jgi:hypothetical protein